MVHFRRSSALALPALWLVAAVPGEARGDREPGDRRAVLGWRLRLDSVESGWLFTPIVAARLHPTFRILSTERRAAPAAAALFSLCFAHRHTDTPYALLEVGRFPGRVLGFLNLLAGRVPGLLLGGPLRPA
jgi:hypothetical protein